MNFKNGIFKTKLFTRINNSKYTIRIICNSKFQKELMVPLFHFIKDIESEDIQIAIREFLFFINEYIDIDLYRMYGCKIAINANNNNENLYVTVI